MVEKVEVEVRGSGANWWKMGKKKRDKKDEKAGKNVDALRLR